MSNCQKDFACRFRQHFTFCCLGDSDLKSHFKNLNTSNTSLTLGEPHKPKHELSTMSSKHDSLCHRKICIFCVYMENNHNSEPRIHLTGNSEFLESFKLTPSPFLNCFRHLEFSQLTMNNGKLILYSRSLLYAIVLNMPHFLILFGMRESSGLFSIVFYMY